MIKIFQNSGATRRRSRLTFKVRIYGQMREVMVEMDGYGMSKTKQTITDSISMCIPTLNLLPTITGHISGNLSMNKIVLNPKISTNKCVVKNKSYSISSVDYIPAFQLILVDSINIQFNQVLGLILEPASQIVNFISISHNIKKEY